MSRFHILTTITAALAVFSITTANYPLLIVTFVCFSIAMGLGVTFPQLRLFGPFICKGISESRVVAITFDDGPDAASTPALLDLLKEENIKAAFFCIGKHVAASPEIVARIASEGHVIGNHTFQHSNSTNFFTEKKLREEMKKTQEAIQTATDVQPVYFRPPMGLSNPRIFRTAHALGMKVIGWSARGLDTRLRNPEKIVARIVKRLRPGAIILLHDGNIPSNQLLETVRLLLNTLRTREYQVVRLDQILR